MGVIWYNTDSTYLCGEKWYITMMKISAFGDEIAVDFEEQLQVLKNLNIGLIDVRQAWGVTCSDFTDEQVQSINDLCAKYNISVACMGSPIGKSPIGDPLDAELNRLKRLGQIARALGTNKIRIFSFYPAGEVTQDDINNSIDRLKQLTELAESLDLQLWLENEKGLVGDTPERNYQLVKAINSPTLQFIWDPANFVQCAADQQVDNWWDKLGPYTQHIHIKDAQLADGEVTPAGEGDGQVKELLTQLQASGFTGVLALEPHLVVAGHSSGFSGADGMEVAVKALRKLMAEVGIEEG